MRKRSRSDDIHDDGRRRAIVAAVLVGLLCLTLAGPAAAQEPEEAPPPAWAGTWVSILPPLLAIAAALITKNVIPALFMGLWFGAFAINGFSLIGAFTGILEAFQVYVLGALANPDHAAIILFSFMIGGMVGIISKNGGMQGVVNRILPLASTPQKGQAATGLMGLIIFFDDYANVLVVGNTMRQVSDRLRVSREKLAYIVDSTAAPVSCVAFITTWIGFEVSLIGDAVDQIPGFNEAGYAVFLSSIPYSFYPLLCMFFVFVVAFSGRDFGPMYQAEVRARTTGHVFDPNSRIDAVAAGHGELDPKEGQPERAVNAALPVLVLIVGVLAGLYATGEGETLREIVGSADSYRALLWASLLAALTAGALSVGQRVLTLAETVDAWYAGLKAMMIAMIILVLAWSLSSVTEVLDTAGYLVSVLGDTLPPAVVPALVFVISAATAFATGSSWGTMGILMPLVIPLSWAVLSANNMADGAHHGVIYSTVACVLAGSVWGDHCSPISDTTILSSMACGSDHIDHVRTQLPYAMLVGGVAVLLGTLPVGFGLPWWVALPVSAGVLVAAHRYLSKPVDGT
jgi:Na+/H+ antiporter NhaC